MQAGKWLDSPSCDAVSDMVVSECVRLPVIATRLICRRGDLRVLHEMDGRFELDWALPSITVAASQGLPLILDSDDRLG